MNILFVTYGLPYPPDSGVRIRDYSLIRYMARHHSVLLLSLIVSPEQLNDLAKLKIFCRELDYVLVKKRSIKDHFAKIIRHIGSGRPLATYPYFYEEMIRKIKDICQKQAIDLIQIEHSFLAPYIEAVPENGICKKVLSLHNVGFQQYRRMIRLKNGHWQRFLFILKWLLMYKWEARYAAKYDRCIVVSPDEARLLKSRNPRLAVSVIENGVDTVNLALIEKQAEEPGLLFVGTMVYPPNEDAIRYFTERIFPLIKNRIPDVRLYVVGHEPAASVRALAVDENISIIGRVADVSYFYQKAQVSIVPLRGGGGTRLKILESMALGRAVVSTSIGCEGLNVVDREHIMIADQPTEFAERAVLLLQDQELRTKLVRNARRLVERQYDWSVIGKKLLKVYSDLG